MDSYSKPDLPQAEEQISLDEELLSLIANQVRTSPANMIFAMSILAYFMYGYLPDKPWIWGGWMLLVICSQLYRRHRLLLLPEQKSRPVKQRTREAAQINFVCALIQSLSFLAFPMFTPFEAAVQTTLFIAMGVGSIVAAVGWRPFALTHIGVSLLPLFGLWIWSGIAGPAQGTGILVGLIGFSYSSTMRLISKRLFKMNVDFFDNREALAKALNDSKKANMAKTRFLAAASHDLRQPVHSLTLFSAALGMGALDERAKRISHSIDEAVTALSTQLDALLDVSKLDAGIVSVNMERFSLSRMLERLADEYQTQCEQANIKLETRFPADAAAHTDPALLERTLRNIMSNAVSHNRDCSVKLSLSRNPPYWDLQIADTGSGIPISEHEHIFEEFYQANNPERERNKGLGLGLSIVTRLASLLDLNMRFNSEPGVGTRFAFSIPQDKGVLKEHINNVTDQFSLQGLDVLVVDNEPTIREGMKTLLEMMGCQVYLADGSHKALQITAETQPHLALVDYGLGSDENGVETVAQLRELQPDIPAIIISGDTSPERLQEVQKLGLKLLTKPVGPDVLTQAISETLGLSGKQQR